MSRRIVVNLAFFGLLGVALAAWAVTNVVSLDFVDHPYEVRAEFATSPGLSPRFEVTYLGQRIGSIRSVGLRGDRVEVAMRIDDGIRVPADVTAAVRRKSAVGEPYVDLSPVPSRLAGGRRLAPGDLIPLERTSTPLAYSALFVAVDDLLRSVDPKALATMVHELATALDGRSASLRQIVTSTGQVAGDLAANATLVDQVVSDLTTLTHTLAAHAGSLGSGVDDVAAVSQTLAASQQELDGLLAGGPVFAQQLAEVLAASADSLGCTLDGLGALGARLDAPTTDALSRLISLSPQFAYVLRGLTAPSQGVGGGLFFNNGTGTPVPVYPQPHAPPVVPAIPACGSTATGGGTGTGSSTAAGGTAAGEPGTASGTTPSPAAGAGATGAAEPSSTKPGEGSGGLLSLPSGLPLLAAVLALAGAAWWVLARRRRDGEDATDA